MMDRREEQLSAEADAWTVFNEQLARVPTGRREEPGLPEGWSVKDLLWHVACWADELPPALPQMEAGTFVDPYEDDAVGEQRNADILVEARAMVLADVEAALPEARLRARAALEAMRQIDDVAAHAFFTETTEHYQDHLGDLQAFANAVSPPSS
jgi:hypothetical protein